MIRHRFIGSAIIAGLVLCGSALAEDAYTAKDANLRAGPSRDYPLVARIPAGSSVEVAGCLNDYAWCDVIAGPDRGWMYAGNLEYPYEGHRVMILQEGPVIGLPIVTFSVGSYWDNYYRGRPWYGRRSYWSARPLPQHRVWVRPSTGFRPGTRFDNRPSGARPYQPRYSGRSSPRPSVAQPSRAPQPVQVRPSRPVPQRPPQTLEQRKQPAVRQNPPQRGRQGHPEKGKKDHGPGGR